MNYRVQKEGKPFLKKLFTSSEGTLKNSPIGYAALFLLFFCLTGYCLIYGFPEKGSSRVTVFQEKPALFTIKALATCGITTWIAYKAVRAWKKHDSQV